MPFALIIAGLVLTISGVRGTQDDLLTLLRGDFTGQNNFIYWVIAILIIGSLGYIKSLEPVSRAFLALVLVVLFLKRGNPNGVGGGFFEKFTQQIGTTEK